MGLARRSGYNLKTWEKVWAQAIGRSQVDSRDLMKGLVDILLKQWFNRIWVIQEVALATKEPVMLVGRAWCYPQALRYLCDAIFSDPRMNATVHTSQRKYRYIDLFRFLTLNSTALSRNNRRLWHQIQTCPGKYDRSFSFWSKLNCASRRPQH
jgi:hypothetical protein